MWFGLIFLCVRCVPIIRNEKNLFFCGGMYNGVLYEPGFAGVKAAREQENRVLHGKQGIEFAQAQRLRRSVAFAVLFGCPRVRLLSFAFFFKC